eukprot:m.150473 g.150473  ORF g.150473 m.150473 type:complete len:250 (+) comp23303_c0_seq1:305-1054(+)
MAAATEANRVRDVRFLQTCGQRLGLSDVVTATAAQCYHRVGQTVLAGEVDPVLLGITLLYVAAKCTDNPRDLRDCITVGVSVADPESSAPMPIDSRYREVRESVVSAEQLVLRALGFDVVMDVPVRRLLLFFLLSFERDLPTVTAQGEGGVGAQLKPESFAQLARTCTAIVNDVVTTSVCIEHPPEELAAGILYLGASLNTSFMTIDVVERYVGMLVPSLRDSAVLAKAVDSLLTVYECPQLKREELRQ